MTTEQKLVLSSAMMKPIGTKEELKQAIDEFQQYKQYILNAHDKTKFRVKNKETGKLEEKEFCNKSGCQKLALAFFISCDVIHDEVQHLPDGTIIARVWAKSVHTPSGRYFTSVAACSSKEKMRDIYEDVNDPDNPGKTKKIKVGEELFNPDRVEHDILTHAQTRASNRSILSILGSGEVSAEEMESEKGDGIDSTIQSNFCRDPSHKHTADEEKNNKCAKCNKMLRMPN